MISYFRYQRILSIAGTILLFAATAWGQQSGMSRAELLATSQTNLVRAVDPVERLTIEYHSAFLWLGEGCADVPDYERFKNEAKRILRDYSAVNRHYYYCNLQVTYAQLLPSKEGLELMWEVIVADPREVQPPSGSMPARWVNRLKQGAIWAYLNTKLGGFDADETEQQKKARVDKVTQDLLARLQGSPEGKRCAPFASWWSAVLKADNPKSVVPPDVVPPPPSRWDETAQWSSDFKPKVPPAVVASMPSEPKVRALSIPPRNLEDVKILGTIQPTKPQEADSNTWLWIALGGGWLLMTVEGVRIWQSRRAKEPV